MADDLLPAWLLPTRSSPPRGHYSQAGRPTAGFATPLRRPPETMAVGQPDDAHAVDRAFGLPASSATSGLALQSRRKKVTSPALCNVDRVETRWYLLSYAFTPECFNAIVRSHWSMESSLLGSA